MMVYSFQGNSSERAVKQHWAPHSSVQPSGSTDAELVGSWHDGKAPQ